MARGVTHGRGCRIDTPKSGKARTVVVPPHIQSAVKHHLDTFTAAGDEALVFPPVMGGCHLLNSVLVRVWRPALKTIRRSDMRVHDLRHFCGTYTAIAGGTLADNMKRLGHSTVRASLIYQQAVDGRQVEIAAALSRLAERG